MWACGRGSALPRGYRSFFVRAKKEPKKARQGRGESVGASLRSFGREGLRSASPLACRMSRRCRAALCGCTVPCAFLRHWRRRMERSQPPPGAGTRKRALDAPLHSRYGTYQYGAFAERQVRCGTYLTYNATALRQAAGVGWGARCPRFTGRGCGPSRVPTPGFGTRIRALDAPLHSRYGTYQYGASAERHAPCATYLYSVPLRFPLSSRVFSPLASARPVNGPLGPPPSLALASDENPSRIQGKS